MYLKRLEIQGFKSFAQKTVLDFIPPQSGRFSITAVVGPNGSGKSNISDAIRWVMGEQSMKVLRGKKSEDIIFSGSETKGQLGASEVVLVLDNSDGKVLSDYAEITIARRVYRSGEGEYFINNNKARLFDVRLLLAKAQFAEHAYSVIGQGMIDRLLAVSSAERKDFMDEASGIKEYQIKRHQADLKLTHTLENMTQAERLLQEVEPRLKLLARQVKKLEKRQEVELKLRETQEKYYVTIYLHNQKEIEDLLKKLKVVEDDYRQSFSDLEKIQTELAELSRSATRQESFQELESRFQSAHTIKNNLDKKLAILEGQMHTEYSQSGKQNIGWLENKLNDLKNEKKKAEQDVLQAKNEEARFENLVNEYKQKVENLALEKTQRVLKISRLQTEMMKDKSEQSYLQFSGLTAVRAVLQNHHRFGKVYGTVAELGEVSEEYTTALEAAAGMYLSALAVEDEKTARLAVDYLRENRLGVVTFLPLTRIQAPPVFADMARLLSYPDVLGPAINFVKYNKKFEELFSYLFGNTLLVKDLRVAESLKGEKIRLVTLYGDLVERSGVIKGGFRQKRNGLGFSSKSSIDTADRLQEYQTEINTEQENLSEIEKLLETAKTQLVGYEVEKRSVLARAEMFITQENNLISEISSLERELSLSQISPEEYTKELKSLSKEKEELLKKISEAENDLKSINKEMEDFNNKEEEKKRKVFSLQEQMQTKQNTVNNTLAERNELKIEMAKLETKQEGLVAEVLSDMNEALNSILARNPVVVEFTELSVLADEIQKLKYQLSLIGGIDEEVLTEHAETKERFDFLSGQLTDLKKATANLNTMIADLDGLMKKKRSTAFKKINKEFDRYFKILFGGGKASLEELYGELPTEEAEMELTVNNENQTSVLEDATSEIVLEKNTGKKEKVLTGIDIFVNPPGKKIKYINSLSGGERTLTSIALICAILNYNPSPFVVLDEVEAALDEANTGRFVKIMSELCTQSQFIVITHNRVTMHSADALYGVVMGGDGVSKLLSVKISEAEKFDEGSFVDKK